MVIATLYISETRSQEEVIQAAYNGNLPLSQQCQDWSQHL